MKAWILAAALLLLPSTAGAQTRPVYMADAEPRAITYAFDQGGAADAILYGLLMGSAVAVLSASVFYTEDGEWSRGEQAAIGFAVGFVGGLVFWAIEDKRTDDG
jgi:hypothetical protein